MTALDDARAWAAVDPDPRAATHLLARLDTDPAGVEALFSGRLEFGTAGIRGPLGIGPLRMNRVLVRAVAAAVARRVRAERIVDQKPTIVVAHDARHQSEAFASDSARVFAAQGIDVVVFDGPAPTPLVPFAVRRLGARAGVVVTASHNPATDSGYKVYWHDGAQIVPPTDAEISLEIETGGLVDEPALAPPDDPRIRRDDGTLREAYMAMATSLVTAPATELTTVYTPIHGVGGPTLLAAFQRVGHARPHVVEQQELPDPDFPTAPFPNPEEPGVLDLAFALATDVEADLVLANDPDADRLAVGVPTADGWRRLTGDDVGALLGDHILAAGLGPDRLVVTTIVSSRLLERIAGDYGARFATTLTGFKWIVRPGFDDPSAQFVFGYEEALGYACTDAVADKDGITAALVVADLAAELKAEGMTLLDRLHELGRRHGVHRTGQRSLRFDAALPAGGLEALMATLRRNPPQTIGGHEVIDIVDHLIHPNPSMATDALIYELADRARLVIRPSGTEPKVKIYGEVVEPCGPDPAESFAAVDAAVDELLAAAPADLDLLAEPS